VAELYAGVKDNEERKELDEFVELFPILPVTPEIAKMGASINVTISKLTALDWQTLSQRPQPKFTVQTSKL
jgi:predicted nucleic acid-binding protein